MARIVAYHPTINVRRGDEVFAIKADLDNFYSDEEIIIKLADSVQADTMGEIILALERDEGSVKSPGVIACHLERGVSTNDRALDWNQPVVR